ncbi:MAG: hypothetical protein JWN15_851 [Firmicutes bacterium]|nr:hypothetical protein [Bacillota bacterium]
MDVKELGELGEQLRRLGHDRRKTVAEIVKNAEKDAGQANVFYRDLDRISDQAISLMQRQKSMIREDLGPQGMSPEA